MKNKLNGRNKSSFNQLQSSGSFTFEEKNLNSSFLNPFFSSAPTHGWLLKKKLKAVFLNVGYMKNQNAFTSIWFSQDLYCWVFQDKDVQLSWNFSFCSMYHTFPSCIYTISHSVVKRDTNKKTLRNTNKLRKLICR